MFQFLTLVGSVKLPLTYLYTLQSCAYTTKSGLLEEVCCVCTNIRFVLLSGRIFIRTYLKKNRQIVEIHKVIYSTFKAAIHT